MKEIKSKVNTEVQKLWELLKKLKKQNEQLHICNAGGASGGSPKQLFGSIQSSGGLVTYMHPDMALAAAVDSPLFPLTFPCHRQEQPSAPGTRESLPQPQQSWAQVASA